MRDYYAKNREHWLELQRARRITSNASREYDRVRYHTDPDHRLRKIARNKVGLALRRGKLERQPCEVCGERPAEAHHDDYTRPLDVRWLCKQHHLEHHRELNEATP